MSKILKYLNAQTDLNIGSANAIFMDLLFSWLRKCSLHKSEKLPYGQLMLEAQLYINEHIEDKLTVAQLASQFNFSEQYFRKLFANVIGCSPKKYIEKIKIERVFTLLKSTNLTISEIADRLNFSNSHHLANAFQNAYNMSPTECRNSTI